VNENRSIVVRRPQEISEIFDRNLNTPQRPEDGVYTVIIGNARVNWINGVREY
jgi:hypothetical protein